MKDAQRSLAVEKTDVLTVPAKQGDCLWMGCSLTVAFYLNRIQVCGVSVGSLLLQNQVAQSSKQAEHP